jgi:dCTP diphosphatase
MELTLNEIMNRIRKFRDDRDWMQFHDPKNMAISIVIEASELLEQFQWKNEKEVVDHTISNLEDIKDEIADIALYLFELSDNIGINILEAIDNKMRKNNIKYPVEKAKGNAKKYNKL